MAARPRFTLRTLFLATTWFAVAAAALAGAGQAITARPTPFAAAAMLLFWAAVFAMGAGVGTLFGKPVHGGIAGLFAMLMVAIVAMIGSVIRWAMFG